GPSPAWSLGGGPTVMNALAGTPPHGPAHARAFSAQSALSLLGRLLPELARFSLGALWALGALAVLGWWAAGHFALARLVRNAVPVPRRRWHERLWGAGAPQGILPDVRVAISPMVSAPLMWGLLAPVILLPRESLAWPRERQRDA